MWSRRRSKWLERSRIGRLRMALGIRRSYPRQCRWQDLAADRRRQEALVEAEAPWCLRLPARAVLAPQADKGAGPKEAGWADRSIWDRWQRPLATRAEAAVARES